MGQTAWFLIVPGVLDIAAVAIHFGDALHLFKLEVPGLGWAAVIVSVAFTAWGLAGKGQGEANRFGPATA